MKRVKKLIAILILCVVVLLFGGGAIAAMVFAFIKDPSGIIFALSTIAAIVLISWAVCWAIENI